jgi:hypothetical protein
MNFVLSKFLVEKEEKGDAVNMDDEFIDGACIINADGLYFPDCL